MCVCAKNCPNCYYVSMWLYIKFSNLALLTVSSHHLRVNSCGAAGKAGCCGRCPSALNIQFQIDIATGEVVYI